MSIDTIQKASILTLEKSIQQMNSHFDRWVDLQAINLFELKILWFLFNETAHTKTKIVLELNLWEEQAALSLERLRREGFIQDDQLFFGGKMIYIYQLSELGRFVLYNSNYMNSPGIS